VINKLKKVAEGLEKASKTHAGQAKTVRSVLGKLGPFKMKSPMKCWTKAGYRRRPGTVAGTKGSCYKPGKKKK